MRIDEIEEEQMRWMGVRPIHSSLSAGEPRTEAMISNHGGEGIGVINAPEEWRYAG